MGKYIKTNIKAFKGQILKAGSGRGKTLLFLFVHIYLLYSEYC